VISTQSLAEHHLQEAFRHLSMAESLILELPREDSAELAASITRVRYQVTDMAIEIKAKAP
jgi:hypothetical protein